MSVDKTINFTERSAQADTPATGDWRLYFKSGGLYTLDDAGTETLVGSGSGANTALSNLAAVAINTSLISDTDSTDDLGSTSVYWRNAYLDTVYLTEQAAPSTPAAGKVVIYPKADGFMYSKDDAGVETLMSGGSGGGGMTDFTVAADSGTPETVADGNTLTIAGGDGITTTVSATDTVTAAVDNTVIRTTGTQSIGNGLTITTPTIASFANATHNHSNAAGGGTIDASVITYTPTTLTDWDADADPGDVDNALDQLAERVDDLEGAGGGGNSFAILADEKAANTQGGASSATTWNARDLNTEIVDADAIVSIASNQFTPIAGTYRIRVEAPAYRTGTNRLRLYNVTGAASVKEGQNARSANADDSVANATLDYVFTANGTDAYRIDHYTVTAVASNGLGVLLNVGGASERYLVIYLEKIA